jgi:cellulose synthase/poly-beta-1,6-N-acetylglucosamine synthase-like glycosyltransferase
LTHERHIIELSLLRHLFPPLFVFFCHHIFVLHLLLDNPRVLSYHLLSVKISIIVTTRERPASLVRLLHSLKPQLVYDNHELFVAENGTSVPAQIEVAGLTLTHLHDTQPGKCRIQNRAIVQATGELLVFLDDDVVATPDYVAAVQRFFDDCPQFAAMKGRILAAEDPFTAVGPMAPYLDLPIVDHGDEVLEVRGVVGANMAYRASALRMVGLFDERLGPGAAGHEEETEMSQRMRRAGLRIGYAPSALVLHEVDPARAIRKRFIRIARERGYCRTLHERHSHSEVALNIALAAIRLVVARACRATIARIAREERRLAVAQGMRDGLARVGNYSGPRDNFQ